MHAFKMEEERGHFGRCLRILTEGLRQCPYHEALMLKGIKHLERLGELGTARSLLAQLQSVPINQSWRTLLEGSLLEARAGETETARRIFKFLIQQAPQKASPPPFFPYVATPFLPYVKR